MKKPPRLIVLAGASLLAAALAGGGTWWWSAQRPAPAVGSAYARPAPDYKYVTLDKVLVMLRGRNGEGASSHYMAVELVFKTPPEQERRAKDHLPLLRTVAVKALSSYTVDSASALTVEQFAAALNKAYADSYAAEGHEAPFVEALIAKLIIE